MLSYLTRRNHDIVSAHPLLRVLLPLSALLLAVAACVLIGVGLPLYALVLPASVILAVISFFRPEIAVLIVAVMAPWWFQVEVFSLNLAHLDFITLPALLGASLRLCVTRKDLPIITRQYLPWVGFAVLISLSYAANYGEQDFASGPAFPWHLYKDVLRLPFVFALALLGIRDEKWARAALAAVTVGASIAALQALATMNLTRGLAVGPFGTKNGMGGLLVVTLPIAAGMFLSSRTLQSSGLYGLAALLQLRCLMLTFSRGSWVAVAISLCLLAVFAKKTKVVPALLFLMCLVGMLCLANPARLQGAVASHLTTLREGTKVDNLVWRYGRWEHFINKVKERPLFGTGEDVDPSLGVNANTPHSGYLTMAVLRGLPALFCFILLPIGALLNSATVFCRERFAVRGELSLVLLCSISGLLVHNIAEATFLMPQITQIFWILCAISVVLRTKSRMITPRVLSEVSNEQLVLIPEEKCALVP